MARDKKGRFLPGGVGNPKGRAPRAREYRFLELMKEAVTEEDWLMIIRRAVEQSIRGDHQARKWLSENLIGAPIQRQEITGADGGALQVQAVEAAISRLYGDNDDSS